MPEKKENFQDVVAYVESVRHILTSNGVSEEDIDRFVNTPNKNTIEKLMDELVKYGPTVKQIIAGINNMI